jgi:hypothetical protein
MSLKGKGVPSGPPLLKNAALAPVVFFDNVPVYGALGGNVEIELSARMLMPKPDGGVGVDMTCAAHLRCSINAAMLLRDALDKAIRMATAKQAARQPAAEDDGEEPHSPLLSN